HRKAIAGKYKRVAACLATKSPLSPTGARFDSPGRSALGSVESSTTKPHRGEIRHRPREGVPAISRRLSPPVADDTAGKDAAASIRPRRGRSASAKVLRAFVTLIPRPPSPPLPAPCHPSGVKLSRAVTGGIVPARRDSTPG